LILRPSTIFLTALLFLFPNTSPSMNATKIMIFPLSASASLNRFAWVGEGIALSLSSQLAGRRVKPMERGERIKLVEALDLPPQASLSHGSMIRVAQRASADLAIIGSYSGTEQNLRVSVRVLNVKSLKLSGEMVANGPLSVLPQLENELAWMILTNMNLETLSSREKFRDRMRSIPNSAYALYIESLDAADEQNQLRLLLKAVAEYRDFSKAHLQIGRLYFKKGDYDNAISHLSLGRNEKEIAPDSEFMLGTCYLQKSQLAQAIQIYERMLHVDRSFEVLNNIGIAFLQKGDNALALNALVEAKHLAQADATVSLNLAIARHLQGNDSAAQSVLDEAIRLHPRSGMLQFLLSYLLKMQGENEKAAAAGSKAKSLGISIDKLQLDDPKSWLRPLLTLEGQTNSSFP
jgi:tetratricopeptide (TPR) repeat protein